MVAKLHEITHQSMAAPQIPHLAVANSPTIAPRPQCVVHSIRWIMQNIFGDWNGWEIGRVVRNLSSELSLHLGAAQCRGQLPALC
jgi:hypothetical protein